MSAYSPGSATLLANGDAEQVDLLRVNANFFPMLGISPLAGRDFLAEEDQPGAPSVAMLSYTLWQARFGGDPSIVGRGMDLDGEMVRVIGILPRGFAFPTRAADVYLPIAPARFVEVPDLRL